MMHAMCRIRHAWFTDTIMDGPMPRRVKQCSRCGLCTLAPPRRRRGHLAMMPGTNMPVRLWLLASLAIDAPLLIALLIRA